ncbi:hypothetical protein ACFYUG_24365 [Streptomyces albogriseolus]|uniref:hypothetical protein n=1 Tax=Streptomyces albogriseolus TaxID=1887 RepID=UPI0036954C3A
MAAAIRRSAAGEGGLQGAVGEGRDGDLVRGEGGLADTDAPGRVGERGGDRPRGRVLGRVDLGRG